MTTNGGGEGTSTIILGANSYGKAKVRLVKVFSLPNLHHWLVDLSAFGMTNDKEIYVAPSEPQGLIEATIVRSTSTAGS